MLTINNTNAPVRPSAKTTRPQNGTASLRVTSGAALRYPVSATPNDQPTDVMLTPAGLRVALSPVPARRCASLSPRVADRLYQVADALWRDWEGAGLADDFDTTMILAVLRFLEKVGTARPNGTHRSDEAQAEFAEALLRRFWAGNARRDAARWAAQQERGSRPAAASLEVLGESAATSQLYDTLQDDLLAGETGRTVVEFLMGIGWARERAWAFVLRESGREWDDVAYLLSERFEAFATVGQLRKWGERYFEPVKPLVQDFLEGNARPNGGASGQAKERTRKAMKEVVCA